MNKTIIFISGWMVPNWLAKTRFVWDDRMWLDYRTLYLESKTPTSDEMIGRELNRLQDIVAANPGCTVVGRSLGAWWAANLLCRPRTNIRKMVFWTPVSDVSVYPIFKASRFYHPLNRVQHWLQNTGPHRVLTLNAKYDLLTPPDGHGKDLAKHFNSMTYELNGGHIYQLNHKAALQYMKDWIETQ